MDRLFFMWGVGSAHLLRELINLQAHVRDGAVSGLDLHVPSHLIGSILDACRVLDQHDFWTVFDSAHVQVLPVFSLLPSEY